MFEKLDHINLTVADLQESLDWYAKVFGFEKMESGRAMGSPYAITGRGDFMICMYEEKNRKKADEMGDSTFHQIYHFGIRVTDTQAWREVLRKNSIPVSYGGEISYPRSTS